jgi:uridylate kinase
MTEDRPVVLAVGGSVLATGDQDPQAWIQWTEAVKEWSRERPIAIVVGGGRPARNAIALARAGSTSEDDLDRIGIHATRLNASILLALLKGNGVDANHRVPRATDRAASELDEHSVVVMGGTTPGHSTDFVAAELAQKVRAARLVIVSNVDGVYTQDPHKHPDAKRLAATTFDELLHIVGGPAWTQAGAPGIVDGPAAALLKSTRTATCVVSGRNLTNVGNAVRGQDFDGTSVRDAASAASGAPAGKKVRVAGDA